MSSVPMHLRRLASPSPVSLGDTDGSWSHALRDVESFVRIWAELDLRLSTHRAALLLGFRSSDALHEWLTTHDLPPYLVLRNWYYVVRLVELSQQRSLAEWTLRGGHDPSIYYRFAKRVTGCSWSELRRLGAGWAKARAMEIWRPYGLRQ